MMIRNKENKNESPCKENVPIQLRKFTGQGLKPRAYSQNSRNTNQQSSLWPPTKLSAAQHRVFHPSRHDALNHRSIVLVGDPKCGKSSLVLTYLAQRYTHPKGLSPVDTYEKVIHFNNSQPVNLQIWDIPGDEEYDRFRPLAYTGAKGVLICFNLEMPGTFQSIQFKWIPELETHCPAAERIIVGIGSHLRSDPKMAHGLPSIEYCQQYASSIGCKYMECSLLNNRSYSRIFEGMAMILNKDYSPNHLPSLTELPKVRSPNRLQTLEESPRRSSFKKRHSVCTIV